MRLSVVVIALSVLLARGNVLLAVQAPTDEEVLINSAVVLLVQSKLDRRLILTKIQSSPNAFDVSAAGLTALHAAKIPRDIIQAMLEAAAEESAEDSLTNADVIYMVEGKVPQSLIMDKINASNSAFDVTATGLIQLQEHRVPRALIALMMEAGNGGPRSAVGGEARGGTSRVIAGGDSPSGSREASRPRDPTPPLPLDAIPEEAGIYAYSVAARGGRVTRLEPTVYTASRTANLLGAALTGGISRAKIKAVARSPRAAIQIDDPMVEFYFVFEVSSGGLSNTNWFATLTSPNEFSLVAFEVKRTTREVTIAEAGAFGTEVGTDDKATIQFSLERLSPGVYRVVPERPLGVGQYAFLSVAGPMGSAGGAAGPNRLFDFGVGRAP